MEIGDILIGTITSVKPYAFFVTFEDGSKGLCHISELSDSYIKDIERFGTVGNKLSLKIINIDENNGFLRTSFKQVPVEQRFSDYDNKKQNTHKEEQDFSPLKEKLEGWINTTLLEAKENDK